VRLLITMNMASAQGFAVHQVTVDHASKDLSEFLDVVNDFEFIMARQWYRSKTPNGEVSWKDRGDIVINTAHIGKVQEFIEFEAKENSYDESYGHPEASGAYFGGQRTEVRKRRGVL
jgi:hypothetical protein